MVSTYRKPCVLYAFKGLSLVPNEKTDTLSNDSNVVSARCSLSIQRIIRYYEGIAIHVSLIHVFL
jgi:hypothetical protein